MVYQRRNTILKKGFGTTVLNLLVIVRRLRGPSLTPCGASVLATIRSVILASQGLFNTPVGLSLSYRRVVDLCLAPKSSKSEYE